jgi:predicted dehydrogenase
MKRMITRRRFLKTAGAGTAGLTIATGFNPFTYAANEKVRVGVLGIGNQGAYHVKTGLAANAADVHIAAVCDCFLPHQKSGVMFAQCANGGIGFLPGEHPRDLKDKHPAIYEKARAAFKPKGYYDYREMIAQEDLDAVIISTPLRDHYPMTMACLDAGLQVFCEKTMTWSIDEAREVVRRCHDTNRFVQVGHQRRYNPKYRCGMDAAYGKEMLGRIHFIHAQWHRNHYWRRHLGPLADYKQNDQETAFFTDIERHLNWRMYEETSHGLYSELMTHQSDVANWFLRKIPARVHAFGGTDYWRDGRDVDDNIQVTFEYDLAPGDEGFFTITPRSEAQKMARINKGYGVRFVYSSILSNARQGCSESICGDWGSLRLTERDGCLYYPEAAPAREAAAKLKAAEARGQKASTEGGIHTLGSLMESVAAADNGLPVLGTCTLEEADVYQFAAFVKSVRTNTPPAANQMCGLAATITANKALEARQSGATVEIDPALFAFDFETPDAFSWTFNREAYDCAPVEQETEGEGQPVIDGYTSAT